MCLPNWPSPDRYDNHPSVPPHFSPTPHLTNISRGHHLNALEGPPLINHVSQSLLCLFHKHNIERCPRYGLYWASSKDWNEIPIRDKTVVLVIELRAEDILRWREIDTEIRDLMRLYGLSGKHGVCVRYYEYHDEVDVQDLDPPALQQPANSSEDSLENSRSLRRVRALERAYARVSRDSQRASTERQRASLGLAPRLSLRDLQIQAPAATQRARTPPPAYSAVPRIVRIGPPEV